MCDVYFNLKFLAVLQALMKFNVVYEGIIVNLFRPVENLSTVKCSDATLKIFYTICQNQLYLNPQRTFTEFAVISRRKIFTFYYIFTISAIDLIFLTFSVTFVFYNVAGLNFLNLY